MRTAHPSTFSIVAFDPRVGELGVATQSKFLAVGSVVPWARADAGAVATQSWANTAYGPRLLERLATGEHPQRALDAVLADDPEREQRQVGVVDTRGRAATFTGAGCFPWAGGRAGDGFACQGNILVSAETVTAMVESWERSTADELALRLVRALEAGQAAGGDARGQQSAALLVVRAAGGYGGFNDRYLDLRVDDHPAPIEELRRLLSLHHLYYPRPDEPTEELTGETERGLATDLVALGRLAEDARDDPTRIADALRRFCLTENLEERLRDDGRIDSAVVAFIRDKAGRASPG